LRLRAASDGPTIAELGQELDPNSRRR